MQADFYLLDSPHVFDQFDYSVKLTNKAWQQSFDIYIQTADDEASKAFSESLWSCSPDSFLPHRIDSADSQPANPAAASIVVSHDNQFAAKSDKTLLLLLHQALPRNWEQATRLAVVASNNPTQLDYARKLYAQLRDSQITARIHDFRHNK